LALKCFIPFFPGEAVARTFGWPSSRCGNVSRMMGRRMRRMRRRRRRNKNIHPGRLTWNIIMEVWKIIFLSKRVVCMFHVNLSRV